MSKLNPTARAVMELTSRDCKWPIGDPGQPGFGFCECLREPGKPYCAEHVERSVGAGTRSEREATHWLKKQVKRAEREAA